MLTTDHEITEKKLQWNNFQYVVSLIGIQIAFQPIKATERSAVKNL